MAGRAPIPESGEIADLAQAAASCQACDLWQDATQTVFGEGPAGAQLMLVGEQPGDKEDLAGQPFVGPAGQLLDEGLAAAGIDRQSVYVTNAVKHFKWRKQGKRRLHEKPNAREVSACRPWLEAEIRAVRPRAVVCLGATAAQALIGRDFKVTRERGKLLERPGLPPLVATVHPSSILRAPDAASRHSAMEAFIKDLSNLRPLLARR
ncbi:MAG: UdgX family uracil-DNA binding protein [Chloroflexi bacterium]|nr:MAG: UdgX family uracil-DNA binding protein [Chloroflexota bacterium]TME15382.1 MAG: UdgX family uracil-DNA binding protein [Chloroflexota bacterium]TME18589.1 MAG: UdgX family uracil-DNA binding protein [Chloroflexota bacterium]